MAFDVLVTDEAFADLVFVDDRRDRQSLGDAGTMPVGA
jgi:hypothetical protein